MTVDPLQLALASGLSMVCATCSKYRLAMEQGLKQCLAVDGCGSPIIGDTFHEYEGPITDFLKYCFVCGADSQKALAVKGHSRRIGVCLKHLDYVVSMAPRGRERRLPVLPTRTFTSGGREERVEVLLPPPPKTENTLSGLMAKLEQGDEPES